MDGLIDLRMSQVSSRRAPVDEVLGVVRLYCSGYRGWNVKHFDPDRATSVAERVRRTAIVARLREEFAARLAVQIAEERVELESVSLNTAGMRNGRTSAA